MSNKDWLNGQLPLDGKEVKTHSRCWRIAVDELIDGAHTTVRTAKLTLKGNPDHKLTIMVPAEVLVVEHAEGDIEWLVDSIRLWLNTSDPKGEDNLVEIGFR